MQWKPWTIIKSVINEEQFVAFMDGLNARGKPINLHKYMKIYVFLNGFHIQKIFSKH